MNRRDRLIKKEGITKLLWVKNGEKFTSPPFKKRVKGGFFRK